ncbi:MAG: PfkB family carbohydrate kinase [Candidatus Zixiibacteriota bacterium]
MITAIGNPVYDLIKTKKVEPKERVLSGCSTNAALALAKLNSRARLIGAVGDDFKHKFESDMKRYGIDYKIIASAQTGGFSLYYYDDFGNRTLNLIGKAADIGDISENWYNDSEAVLIGPILGEVSFENIREIHRNFDGLMFCDPQGLIRGANKKNEIYHEKVDGIEDTLGVFDIVKPNELEGKVLTGIDCREDPYEAAAMIKSWGPKIVIVTLAELGSVIYDGHDFIDIPPYVTETVDATGCGDTYMAGFTFEYLKTGGDLRSAGCFASATSSVMLEHVGPEFPLTETEVRRRQKTLLAKTNYKVDVRINAA